MAQATDKAYFEASVGPYQETRKAVGAINAIKKRDNWTLSEFLRENMSYEFANNEFSIWLNPVISDGDRWLYADRQENICVVSYGEYDSESMTSIEYCALLNVDDPSDPQFILGHCVALDRETRKIGIVGDPLSDEEFTSIIMKEIKESSPFSAPLSKLTSVVKKRHKHSNSSQSESVRESEDA